MWLRDLVIVPLILLATLWAGAALWFDGAESQLLAGALAAGFVASAIGVLVWLRPFSSGLAGFTGLFLAVLVWWFAQMPSNTRNWQSDVARLPVATFAGDRVTIRNVRNFDYQSETAYTEAWEERSYDLSQLIGVDIFLSYWGSPWIAHTVMSWTFADGQHLAISIETRKEEGEEYSAVLGFFRQFEVYYVVADEQDLIGLRTNYRDEDVYLYHLNIPLDTARAILVDYLEEINGLARTPKWYNAMTHNCTTSIHQHFQHVAAGKPFDWRILANGRIDELGYSRGTIDTSLPFAELRKRSAISEKAQAMPAGADYSAWIRVGLPGGHVFAGDIQPGS